MQIADYMGPYDAAFVSPERWNGWLDPSFRLEEVEKIAADTERLAAESSDPAAVDVIEVLPGPVVRMIRGRGCSDEEVIEIEPDENGLYGVGGWYWTWEDADR